MKSKSFLLPQFTVETMRDLVLLRGESTTSIAWLTESHPWAPAICNWWRLRALILYGYLEQSGADVHGEDLLMQTCGLPLALLDFYAHFETHAQTLYVFAKQSGSGVAQAITTCLPFRLDDVVEQSFKDAFGTIQAKLLDIESSGDEEQRTVLRAIDQDLGQSGLSWEPWAWRAESDPVISVILTEHAELFGELRDAAVQTSSSNALLELFDAA